MATPNPRNLVLLLSSGHTVRIALREDDLTTSLDHDPSISVPEMNEFLQSLPAFTCVPDIRSNDVMLAYIEDPSLSATVAGLHGPEMAPPNDFQRISVEGPGTVVQYD